MADDTPTVEQAIAKLRMEHRAGLTPELIAAENALIAAVRAEKATKPRYSDPDDRRPYEPKPRT